MTNSLSWRCSNQALALIILNFTVVSFSMGNNPSPSSEFLKKINDLSVRAPESLGNVALYHDGTNYHVKDNNGHIHKVKKEWCDNFLNNMTASTLEAFQKAGYISARKFEDSDDYALKAHIRGLGGGPGGATAGAIFGKFIVHFIGHGVITIAAIASGPAGPATAASLEVALLPTVIEPMSNAVAIGCGILGGIITEPV